MTLARTRIRTPTGVYVGTFEPGSPDWHAARAHGVGGSEVSAVLGLSRWESRFSLWHRKAGLIPEQDENDEMEAGKRLEPAILKKFADSHPDLILDQCGTFEHVDRPWQIANPDAIAYPFLGKGGDAPVLVEAKFALYPDDFGTPGTDEVPPYYLTQCRWYLDVLGLETCYLQVFFGASAEFREYVVHSHAEDQAFLRQRVREFLDTLPGGLNEQRPDIDQHSATYSAIKAMHPLIDGSSVELTKATALAYCAAKAGAKAAEAAVLQATSALADELRNGKEATYCGQTLARRQSRGDGTPYVVAARKLPTFDDTQEEDAA